MTGPAPGKIPVDLTLEFEGRVMHVQGYIHVKGWSRALVTHLDIEGLDVRSNARLAPAGIVGTVNGFHVFLVSGFWLEIDGTRIRKFTVRGLRLLRYGERSGGCVGVKPGGMFIGFRREVVRRLEDIARKLAPELFTARRERA